jgi:hypothetical protein
VPLGQGYHTPQRAVISEYGEMVEWRFTEENRRNWTEICSSTRSSKQVHYNVNSYWPVFFLDPCVKIYKVHHAGGIFMISSYV